ncbi:hypothetical protein, partial [Aeromonas veronii]|uniref:hypothetical protein n=1 Tax=Aeromonas veronii TaxID=654 RepID=UPI0022451088
MAITYLKILDTTIKIGLGALISAVGCNKRSALHLLPLLILGAIHFVHCTLRLYFNGVRFD